MARKPSRPALPRRPHATLVVAPLDGTTVPELMAETGMSRPWVYLRLREQPRSSLWQPPRAHGEQPRERAVGPLELFYDLAVVVLVGPGRAPLGRAPDMARTRRVHRDVHAGVDRLGQRQPAP